jgi:hypothetical protein
MSFKRLVLALKAKEKFKKSFKKLEFTVIRQQAGYRYRAGDARFWNRFLGGRTDTKRFCSLSSACLCPSVHPKNDSKTERLQHGTDTQSVGPKNEREVQKESEQQ